MISGKSNSYSSKTSLQTVSLEPFSSPLRDEKPAPYEEKHNSSISRKWQARGLHWLFRHSTLAPTTPKGLGPPRC